MFAFEGSCGGARTKRIWSPEREVRVWREERSVVGVRSGVRGRREERREVMRRQREWEEWM